MTTYKFYGCGEGKTRLFAEDMEFESDIQAQHFALAFSEKHDCLVKWAEDDSTDWIYTHYAELEW